MYSELLVPLGGRETLDEVAHHWWNQIVESGGVRCNVFTMSEGAFTGAWDTIWDCACNIRKVSDAADVDKEEE